MRTAAELVACVVGTYDEPEGIASWACWSDDEEVTDLRTGRVCHFQMSETPKGCDNIITAYPGKGDLDKRWFTFMRDILYRPYADHIHLDQAEEGQHYIRLSGCDTLPANVIYSVCISSRIAIEFKKNLKVWDELCNQGVDPTVAFICCGTSAGKNPDIKVNGIFSGVHNTNHWPIDHGTDVQRVLKCDFTALSKPFKTHPRDVRPCNCIWGMDGIAMGRYDNTTLPSLRPLQGSSIRDFSSLLGKDIPANEDVL